MDGSAWEAALLKYWVAYLIAGYAMLVKRKKVLAIFPWMNSYGKISQETA
jgi:hypothetical protein